MSKLTALCGKTKEKIILGEGENKVELELMPPKVSDLSNILGVFDKTGADGKISGEQIEKIAEVLSRMVKQAVPDATDEEIDEIVSTHFQELTNSMTKLLEKSFKTTDVKN